MSLKRTLRRAVDDLELLLEGKLALFLVGDFLAIVWGVFEALSSGGRIHQFYAPGVVLPLLLLLASSLSALVALERRAGSLDLALAAPSPALFFLRRMWPPVALGVLQGWLLLLLAFAEGNPRGVLLEGGGLGWEMLLRAAFSTLLVALLAAAVNLFWATRLRTGGAVFTAVMVTLLPLSPFVFTSPMLPPAQQFAKSYWAANQHVFAWLWPMLVLAAAALLFFLAGLDRLRRPESLT
jgi:hypothetical protein